MLAKAVTITNSRDFWAHNSENTCRQAAKELNLSNNRLLKLNGRAMQWRTDKKWLLCVGHLNGNENSGSTVVPSCQEYILLPAEVISDHAEELEWGTPIFIRAFLQKLRITSELVDAEVGSSHDILDVLQWNDSCRFHQELEEVGTLVLDDARLVQEISHVWIFNAVLKLINYFVVAEEYFMEDEHCGSKSQQVRNWIITLKF